MLCLMFFCTVVLGVLLALPFMAQGQTSQMESCGTFVCVQDGDTLWSIGSQHCAEGFTVTDCVKWIVEHNDLGSSLIVPGQIIEVPVDFQCQPNTLG